MCSQAVSVCGRECMERYECVCVGGGDIWRGVSVCVWGGGVCVGGRGVSVAVCVEVHMYGGVCVNVCGGGV